MIRRIYQHFLGSIPILLSLDSIKQVLYEGISEIVFLECDIGSELNNNASFCSILPQVHLKCGMMREIFSHL